MDNKHISELKIKLKIDHYIRARKAPIWTYIYKIESSADAQGDILLSESTYEMQMDRKYTENQEALQCRNSASK